MVQENTNYNLNTVVRSVDGDNKNSILVSSDADVAFKKRMRDRLKTYTDERLTDKINGLERHLIVGYCTNNLFSCMEYQNILFIPSFRQGKYPDGLMDANYVLIKPNAAQHMAPIINKKFDCVPNIYVAYPEGHTSMYHDQYQEFDVNIIPANGMYTMGMEGYTVTPPEGVVFDAVYFAGHDIELGTTFNASDIREDFAQYCTEDFDIIDHFENEEQKLRAHRGQSIIGERKTPRLTGDQKDISGVCDYIATNTIRMDNFGGNMPEVIRTRFKEILSTMVRIY